MLEMSTSMEHKIPDTNSKKCWNYVKVTYGLRAFPCCISSNAN